MTKYYSPKDWLDAAKAENTSTEDLKYLATSQHEFVLTAVASHPNTDSETLARLLPSAIPTSREQEVVAAVAKNLRTPAETLAHIAELLLFLLDNGRGNDNAFKAGVNLCCNENTPFAAIQWLLGKEQVVTQVRKIIARETRRIDVLQLLSNDRSETVRKKAAQTLKNMQDNVISNS